MAEPIAFLLPFDGFPSSTRCWHSSFDAENNNNNHDNFIIEANNDLAHPYATCGGAAKMAFTQFLNCDALRTPQATNECRAPAAAGQEATLAVQSPTAAAAAVTTTTTVNDKTASLFRWLLARSAIA